MPVLIGITWLLAAVLAGWLGFLELLPPPFPQVVLASLVVILLAAYVFLPRCRQWALGLPMRAFLALHLSRIVGIYFLYLYSLERLPHDFAVLGGWGDILVAAWALLLIAVPVLGGRVHPGGYLVWNLVGLLDILFVVFTAARLALADPASMREITVLPLSLLPTFLVPLIIASHVVMFAKIRQLIPRLPTTDPTRDPGASRS